MSMRSALLVPTTYRVPLTKLLPVILTDVALDVAAPSLSVLVTVTLKLPPWPYWWPPAKVWLTSSTVTVCGALPSPQSTVATCVSSRPGSLKAPCTVTKRRPLVPLLADRAVMVGATLLTASWNEVEDVAPSRSGVVMTTVWDGLGPSLAAKDHDQVPPAFLVTVPAEAASVTMSAPGSLQVPEATAVCPSLTVTVDPVAADSPTVGATLR